MGGSSTEDQTQHQVMHQVQDITQTPTNPSWVQDPIQGIAGRLTDLTATDPYSFIAGPNALQTQAGAGAAGLSGTPWMYDASTDLARGVGQANAPDIASLMNPFKGAFDNRVINPVLAAFDQNSALTNAQNKLGLANDVTFGGSGGAITDALTRGQQALARGQVQGGLLSDQFKTALGGAEAQAQTIQQQMAQRLAAAGLLTSNANDYGANQRANIGAQGTIGSILQGLDQARTGAPLTTAAAEAGIAGSTPFNLFHGQNTHGVTDGTQDTNTHTVQSQSDPLGMIGSLAMLAAAPFTGGASLLGGLGGLGALGAGLGSAAGIGGAMAGAGSLLGRVF